MRIFIFVAPKKSSKIAIIQDGLKRQHAALAAGAPCAYGFQAERLCLQGVSASNPLRDLAGMPTVFNNGPDSGRVNPELRQTLVRRKKNE
ncbi:MAG: hypothetical protein C0613_13655 [Desulfobulbaceae bacterium]|nr:MAG: hypothetical protein C0613_13655 [Desulfobulbaceae bacterium]